MPVWYVTHLKKKNLYICIRKFMVRNSRCVPISPLRRPLCRGCKQIAHVLGKDCDIVFISLKLTENVQRVTLLCSYWFTDTVTDVLVVVKWYHLLWKFSTFSVSFTHETGSSHFVNAQIVVSHNYRTQVLGSTPFTPSVVPKLHDRHRYLSIYHVPYLMSLSIPRHCSKTLSQIVGSR